MSPILRVLDGGEEVQDLTPPPPEKIEPVLRVSIAGDRPYDLEVTPYKVIVRRAGAPTNVVELPGEGWGVPELAHLTAALYGQLPLVQDVAVRLLRMALTDLISHGAEPLLVSVMTSQLVAVESAIAAGAALSRCSRVDTRKRRAHEIRRAVV